MTTHVLDANANWSDLVASGLDPGDTIDLNGFALAIDAGVTIAEIILTSALPGGVATVTSRCDLNGVMVIGSGCTLLVGDYATMTIAWGSTLRTQDDGRISVGLVDVVSNAYLTVYGTLAGAIDVGIGSILYSIGSVEIGAGVSATFYGGSVIQVYGGTLIVSGTLYSDSDSFTIGDPVYYDDGVAMLLTNGGNATIGAGGMLMINNNATCTVEVGGGLTVGPAGELFAAGGVLNVYGWLVLDNGCTLAYGAGVHGERGTIHTALSATVNGPNPDYGESFTFDTGTGIGDLVCGTSFDLRAATIYGTINLRVSGSGCCVLTANGGIGSIVMDATTVPNPAYVLLGTAFNDGQSGTFDEAARNTDPGKDNVLAPASGGPAHYHIAGSTLVGTVTLPAADAVAPNTAYGPSGSLTGEMPLSLLRLN